MRIFKEKSDGEICAKFTNIENDIYSAFNFDLFPGQMFGYLFPPGYVYNKKYKKYEKDRQTNYQIDNKTFFKENTSLPGD